jgi:hypothetical protein
MKFFASIEMGVDSGVVCYFPRQERDGKWNGMVPLFLRQLTKLFADNTYESTVARLSGG